MPFLHHHPCDIPGKLQITEVAGIKLEESTLGDRDAFWTAVTAAVWYRLTFRNFTGSFEVSRFGDRDTLVVPAVEHSDGKVTARFCKQFAKMTREKRVVTAIIDEAFTDVDKTIHTLAASDIASDFVQLHVDLPVWGQEWAVDTQLPMRGPGAVTELPHVVGVVNEEPTDFALKFVLDLKETLSSEEEKQMLAAYATELKCEEVTLQRGGSVLDASIDWAKGFAGADPITVLARGAAMSKPTVPACIAAKVEGEAHDVELVPMLVPVDVSVISEITKMATDFTEEELKNLFFSFKLPFKSECDESVFEGVKEFYSKMFNTAKVSVHRRVQGDILERTFWLEVLVRNPNLEICKSLQKRSSVITAFADDMITKMQGDEKAGQEFLTCPEFILDMIHGPPEEFRWKELEFPSKQVTLFDHTRAAWIDNYIGLTLVYAAAEAASRLAATGWAVSNVKVKAAKEFCTVALDVPVTPAERPFPSREQDIAFLDELPSMEKTIKTRVLESINDSINDTYNRVAALLAMTGPAEPDLSTTKFSCRNTTVNIKAPPFRTCNFTIEYDVMAQSVVSTRRHARLLGGFLPPEPESIFRTIKETVSEKLNIGKDEPTEGADASSDVKADEKQDEGFNFFGLFKKDDKKEEGTEEAKGGESPRPSGRWIAGETPSPAEDTKKEEEEEEKPSTESGSEKGWSLFGLFGKKEESKEQLTEESPEVAKKPVSPKKEESKEKEPEQQQQGKIPQEKGKLSQEIEMKEKKEATKERPASPAKPDDSKESGKGKSTKYTNRKAASKKQSSP
eukprot:NODE_353_length_2617_cov_36.196472_g333_i0.p1 GENE.NODE_353_length_2617_cov_36.196472_g333_i0~~NODE_353_length_2617_cov_36.196472_g333_i0.p1  ORF type:complete len:814 (+),score=214.16 NODE_353_length_2617_cov_36.196472_g333_i0:64-2442(+)